MELKHLLLAFGVSAFVGYFMADKFYRQGYPFWRIWLLGTICTMGIILTLIGVILGKR